MCRTSEQIQLEMKARPLGKHGKHTSFKRPQQFLLMAGINFPPISAIKIHMCTATVTITNT